MAKKNTHRRKVDVACQEDYEQPCTSGLNFRRSRDTDTVLIPTKLRNGDIAPILDQLDISDNEALDSSDDDEEFKPMEKPVGGKCYEKVRIYSVSDECCILADRRMTSIRQQADQLASVVDRRQISASASSIYRRREEVRMKALAKSKVLLAEASALQLCYDGRIIEKLDHYVFFGAICKRQV